MRKVDNVIMAHIHIGAAGVPGPIVVELRPPFNGFSAACTTSSQCGDTIAANPSGYYVNVHSDEFQPGTVPRPTALSSAVQTTDGCLRVCSVP